MTSSFPKGLDTIYGGAEQLSKYLSEATDGNFTLDVFAGGEIVPALQAADAVTAGTVEACHTVSYYFWGKDPTWALFAAVPFSLNARGINAWHYHGGGIELANEFFASQNIVAFPGGNTGVQMGGWFNKEINSVDDFKGLKMRIPGQGGDVMGKLGVSTVALPGGQIYENLVSGAIDATEWVGPYNDYFLKLYEAAKYYYWPGMHEPGAQLTFGANKSWWGTLSKTDQEILRAACNEENSLTMAETNANNGAYLARLINDHGVELREFNDDIYTAFGKAAQEVIEEAKSHSDLSARIMTAVEKARLELGGWTKLSDMAYVQKRNKVLGL